MKTNTPSRQNRKYYLHQKIKARFRYSAQKNTVYVPWQEAMEIDNIHVKELQNKYNYSIQTEIN